MIDSLTDALRVTIIRIVSVGCAMGLGITGLLGEFDRDFVREIVLAMAVLSGAIAVAKFVTPRVPNAVVRSYLILLAGVVFLTALTIQPFGLGTLSGFVFLGIVVAVSTYETRALAIVLGAIAMSLAVAAIIARSSIPVPACVVFLSIAVLCQVSILGFRKASSTALRDAMQDPLTGLTNRRGMEVGVRLLSAVAQRGDDQMGCLIIDLDHFKRINDRFGHSVGDQLLARTARTLTDNTRKSDLLVRLGGDEFALFSLVASDTELLVVAEHVRASIESNHDGPPVTVSIGGSLSRGSDSSDSDEVLARADAAMYGAKRAGRNTVVLDRSAHHDQVAL